ncbi:Na+/H+ antiporter subunit E [Methylocella sp.]|uniref:Na+/H+ antiporter subunit E n=1 Tax=Methylocella sp. TaxID=1978226 RepID=UPI003782F3DF
MTAARASAPGWPILRRAAAFFIFWIFIAGAAPLGLAIGAAASVAAAALSLRLAPSGGARPRPALLMRLGVRFAVQSILAGFDVARRAFAPRLALKPGFVVFRPQIESAGARSAFYALSSLLPGSLPVCEEADGALIVHCLDVGQPVAAQLAAEEAAFARAFGLEASRGCCAARTTPTA